LPAAPRIEAALRIHGWISCAKYGGNVSMSSKFAPHQTTSAGERARMSSCLSISGAIRSASPRIAS
jgi:hypothetical protein